MVTKTDTRVMTSLKTAQANSVVLYLNAKRYHWFTYGPLFRDLHLFWDEVAAAAQAEIDPLGERIRMLGGEPVSAPREIESYASITVAEGRKNPREMLEEALRNEERIIGEMRAAARQADDEGDPGSNDLFATLVQTHEKHAWFIREYLERGDGMVASP